MKADSQRTQTNNNNRLLVSHFLILWIYDTLILRYTFEYFRNESQCPITKSIISIYYYRFNCSRMVFCSPIGELFDRHIFPSLFDINDIAIGDCIARRRTIYNLNLQSEKSTKKNVQSKFNDWTKNRRKK